MKNLVPEERRRQWGSYLACDRCGVRDFPEAGILVSGAGPALCKGCRNLLDGEGKLKS